jgi:hypothetical protein
VRHRPPNLRRLARRLWPAGGPVAAGDTRQRRRPPFRASPSGGVQSTAWPALAASIDPRTPSAVNATVPRHAARGYVNPSSRAKNLLCSDYEYDTFQNTTCFSHIADRDPDPSHENNMPRCAAHFARDGRRAGAYSMTRYEAGRARGGPGHGARRAGGVRPPEARPRRAGRLGARPPPAGRSAVSGSRRRPAAAIDSAPTVSRASAAVGMMLMPPSGAPAGSSCDSARACWW